MRASRAAQDETLRIGLREAAGHRIEQLFAIDLADRRAVRAADVVRLNILGSFNRHARSGRPDQATVIKAHRISCYRGAHVAGYA